MNQKQWRYKFCCLIVLIAVGKFQAQRLSAFQLYPQNNQVLIHFVISAGVSCSGYRISHSTDEWNYQVIKDVPQVCGASGTDEPKDELHANPVINQINYYKIELFPFETAYASVFVPLSSANGTVLVCPNPLPKNQGSLKIKILGGSNSSMQGFICGPEGYRYNELNFKMDSEFCELPVQFTQEGLYYIVLSDGTRSYNAPFLVLDSN